MATVYLVQGYKQKGRQLVADQPQKAKTAEAAIAMAERLAPNRSGIFAYSQDIDIETDSYDEPKVLWKTGSLPPGLVD